ncbi:uncharacterized protein PHALS_03093 [Plasmopara halstedii]|uniref:Uncharacterized protein n=1 Tax=Plasmopara halstedii TaxID=4781 RepID=A0A0P1A8Z5_PLAHL|nr:uncharacterized protein PHALS_03093 [Plasmopara halstedii]CEG36545.1 hypothetical protein PHALS_03093 [Plasmopara halstedii]|eukprot:XP_024572914.1 hypothetical protein PHALS_03093 [Plasmopara halstedii]
MVFYPRTERVRQAQTPMLLLNDGSANYELAIVELTNSDEHRGTDSDPDDDGHFWPTSPKRPRIDEDGLLAEAVLAYAASVGEADDAPTTYQQAMDGDDAVGWVYTRFLLLAGQSLGLSLLKQVSENA